MPAGRIVLKKISQSKKLAMLKTDGARLLYTWLIPHVDINGCLSGDPEVVNGTIFTRLKKSTRTVGSYLEDLHNVGLIVRYEANGDQFLIIPDFEEKQPNLNPAREAKGDIPLPTQEQLRSKSGLTPTLSKDKVKQSKEEENNNKSIYFNCEYFLITDEYHQQLQAEFPLIDFQNLLKKLKEYIDDEPDKYKRLPTGRLKHPKLVIRNWCEREKVTGGKYGARSDRPPFDEVERRMRDAERRLRGDHSSTP